MNRLRLPALVILFVMCLSWNILSAGEAAPKTGDPGKKAKAPETPEEEEARIKKAYSGYIVIAIDIEEEISYRGDKKKKVAPRTEIPKWGVRGSIAYALRLTTGRSYKGDRHDKKRKEWKIMDVKNSKLKILSIASKKPKRDSRDKSEKWQSFTVEEIRKHADYILSGKIMFNQLKTSEFYGTTVAKRFEGKLDLELVRVKDKKKVWSKKKETDKSATETAGGEKEAIAFVRVELEKSCCAELAKLSEWKEAEKILPKIAYKVIKAGKSEGVIFPKDAGKSLVAGQVKGVKKYFTPKTKDIEKLEKKLEQYLIANPPEGAPKLHEKLSEYKRQYTGITVEKKKFIYVNLFRDAKGTHKNWRKRAVIVDGGGADYFEIQYDVESGEFSNLRVHDKN